MGTTHPRLLIFAGCPAGDFLRLAAREGVRGGPIHSELSLCFGSLSGATSRTLFVQRGTVSDEIVVQAYQRIGKKSMHSGGAAPISWQREQPGSLRPGASPVPYATLTAQLWKYLLLLGTCAMLAMMREVQLAEFPGLAQLSTIEWSASVITTGALQEFEGSVWGKV